MRYLMLICNDETAVAAMSPTEQEASTARYGAFQEEMGARGVLQGGARLRPTSDATTVRVVNDEVLTGDGPFAETKEQIGGFWVIKAADLDAALAIAARGSAACGRPVEVRPFQDIPGDE